MAKGILVGFALVVPFWLSLASCVFAQGNISRGAVSVCDPLYPERCVKPMPNGNLIIGSFQRTGDPNFLPATTTPRQYAITQPPNTTSYRGVNPCNVDIRIRTVGSMTETVTPTTGTRFLARTAETLGSTQNPTEGATRFVSILALGDPGPNGCVFELGYGNGS